MLRIRPYVAQNFRIEEALRNNGDVTSRCSAFLVQVTQENQMNCIIFAAAYGLGITEELETLKIYDRERGPERKFSANIRMTQHDLDYNPNESSCIFCRISSHKSWRTRAYHQLSPNSFNTETGSLAIELVKPISMIAERKGSKLAPRLLLAFILWFGLTADTCIARMPLHHEVECTGSARLRKVKFEAAEFSPGGAT